MDAQQVALAAMHSATTSSILGAFAATQVAASSSTSLHPCNSHSLSPLDLDLFGAKILHVSATPLLNHTSVLSTARGSIPASTWTNVTVCNVTVTYTHPGRNDEIHINAWLPPPDAWNGRFVAAGGGGWVTGVLSEDLAPLATQGFVAASTDGGHSLFDSSAAAWALDSPGNVDWSALENFASVALNDLATVGKQVSERFYGRPVDYSYWSGCSTGGRQGLMMAQRYPEAFDGILAIAPAINWVRFLVAEYWPPHVMNRLGYYPTPEELDAITAAAIASCDGRDGVEDAIISAPGDCHFDALSLVGQTYQDRDGKQQNFTTEAAQVANAAWRGPRSPNGRYAWYGLTHDAPLTTGLVKTSCQNSSASSCVAAPFSIAEEWLQLFIAKDPTFDLTALTDDEYWDLFHKSVQQYDSIIGTSDPDLEAFRRRGGKMISWHGTADPLIMVNGTSDYYRRVLELDSEAADFYRYFEAPGVGHCSRGRGPMPTGELEALMRWVEEGSVPETLTARSSAGQGGGVVERELCAWPKVQRYIRGDPDVAGSFGCF